MGFQIWIFQAKYLITILIAQLFRAAGYFNSGFLFVVIAGTLLLFIKQKK